jgi:hypothetical protein
LELQAYMSESNKTKPKEVKGLEAAYGPPSQSGFGSAVFYEQLKSGSDLQQAGLDKYRYFVGELWERFGEEAWLSAWRQVYTRPAATRHDIVAELRSIRDPEADLSVPMILENIESPEKARSALSAAFDAPSVNELRVYNLGDGGAMSGILIAGRRTNGQTTFLVFLLD